MNVAFLFYFYLCKSGKTVVTYRPVLPCVTSILGSHNYVIRDILNNWGSYRTFLTAFGIESDQFSENVGVKYNYKYTASVSIASKSLIQRKFGCLGGVLRLGGTRVSLTTSVKMRTTHYVRGVLLIIWTRKVLGKNTISDFVFTKVVKYLRSCPAIRVRGR